MHNSGRKLTMTSTAPKLSLTAHDNNDPPALWYFMKSHIMEIDSRYVSAKTINIFLRQVWFKRDVWRVFRRKGAFYSENVWLSNSQSYSAYVQARNRSDVLKNFRKADFKNNIYRNVKSKKKMTPRCKANPLTLSSVNLAEIVARNGTVLNATKSWPIHFRPHPSPILLFPNQDSTHFTLPCSL